jgi:hypothetical protein
MKLFDVNTFTLPSIVSSDGGYPIAQMISAPSFVNFTKDAFNRYVMISNPVNLENDIKNHTV